MAITQKHKVSFTVKSVVPTEYVNTLIEHIRGAACAEADGKEQYNGHPIDNRMKHIIELFVAGGIDSVLSFMVRYEVRCAVRELSGEYSYITMSPATVRKMS